MDQAQPPGAAPPEPPNTSSRDFKMDQPSKSHEPIDVTYGEEKILRGAGGETHQIATERTPTLTTQQGAPVADDQNSLRAGARGPTLLEDFHFREKLFHFDHERIPQRVVPAA